VAELAPGQRKALDERLAMPVTRYFIHFANDGFHKRYGEGTKEEFDRLDYELSIIILMDFTGYFLIVADFINWAKDHDIPVGPGRGSGAGSIVAYSLRITDIEPLKYNLLFERFLNPERVSMPDFDVDFCFERRQEVIDYVTQKYGTDRVGQIITFGTMKAKAVIKDVARALDIPFEDSNNIAKLVPDDPKMTLEKAFEQEPKLKELAEDPRYTELFEVARKLEGKHRHCSFHAAGIVIGKSVLTDYVPLYRDPKTGALATQFTMDQLEECGLVKMDFLGLKTLTLIKNTLNLIAKRGIKLTEESIPEDDKASFQLLGDGRSTSVFQFESSGMQGVLKQAKPDCIEDIIALNALYRPGPMDYIPQFVDCKWGRKPITYPAPALEKYLKETYGVIVYQEQVMQVAQEIAGYSLGRADLLRRAMGKKKVEILDKERAPFLEGAQARGYTKEKAQEIFDILVPFAGYGFNKSHAAAYSVVAYRTAYLKANYPSEFMAANLTNEISNPDKLTEYIGEARTMGIEILPPNINYSETKFTVVDGKIVYGLLGIKGVGEGLVKAVLAERDKNGPFTDFVEFLERVGMGQMNKKSLEALVLAGCFDEMGHTRRELTLNIERAVDYVQHKEEARAFGQASLFDGSGEEEIPPFAFEGAEEFPRKEVLQTEKDLLGFYFSGHPMDEFRKIWERCADLDLSHTERAAPKRKYTVVAQLKEWREILTKTGRKMAFGSVEDYRGSIEIVVFADMLEQSRDRFAPDAVLCLRGEVDLSRSNPSLKVEEVLDPSGLKEKSYKEIHLRLSEIHAEEDLWELRDTLFESSGPCSVFFHVPGKAGETVVQAYSGISCAPRPEVVDRLRETHHVKEVWLD
jgi:DNA polymerase III subunit alpha